MTKPDHDDNSSQPVPSPLWTGLKLAAAAAFCFSAYTMVQVGPMGELTVVDDSTSSEQHRRLSESDEFPAAARSSPLRKQLQTLYDDLFAREKLFRDTPPEEVKYWFEYTEPLQKYYYRFSRSRGKADYFEGRDDSGVVSARFVPDTGGTKEFQQFFKSKTDVNSKLLEQCLKLGSSSRPNNEDGSVWNDWFGGGSSEPAADRCRILFNINTVGAGRGTTMLWETMPPLPHAEGPVVWTSEQETAASHLERQLEEINQMCASGLIAARVQMLVCEPISPKWTEWMDSKLVACGGKPWPLHRKLGETVELENRASPVQIVVSASATTADTCHDLKSGFMEKRQQDLVLAPSYLAKEDSGYVYKATHPDLMSSDHHDLYIATRWSSLVTIRAVHGFLQASTDLAQAAGSQGSQDVVDGPSSPFLVPSFVRVAYVSEENSKVAKWRMHGDFFHPASWEICKDSFDTTWIANSAGDSAGQWWIYFTELQMPVSPEVYANEITPAVVQGGSNFVWMVTEQHRVEISRGLTCRNEGKSNCQALPQAVIPLGDLESFLINYTPNTALGKEHVKDRRPGYSKAAEREADRKRVKERKQLHDQEEIESALFDYTIYPAALFHKDATLKSARARDAALTSDVKDSGAGPQTCKSSYYDVTITKPRPPHLGWCQAVARKGLCALYSDYFRKTDECAEACGMVHNWSKVGAVAAE